MKRIGLFPGTFDPVTLGHVDIIDRAAHLFDKLYIGIGINTTKEPMFALEKRLKWFNILYKTTPHIEVASYKGLTVDFCKKVNANFLVRGIRSVADFEYEKSIAATNKKLAPEVETVFLNASPENAAMASTLVREVIRSGGDASVFLPPAVVEDLNNDPSVLI